MANKFKILFEKFGKQELIKISNTETNEYVTILPETGGMLLDLVFSFNDESFSVLDAYQNEVELIENLANSFKGSNLFPFPNRIDGGKYTYNGMEHQLLLNFPNEGNSIHGLLFDKKFEVLETFADDEQASIKLQFDTHGELTGYPWPFRIIMEYIFNSGTGLTIKSHFFNTANVKIPAGIGYHPYFKLDSKVNELFLEFPAKEFFQVNNRMLPTGETVIYNEFNKSKRINTTDFDSCFALDSSSSPAETIIYSEKLKGGISIWQKTGNKQLNYLQVYTPPHRESIAIEPMTCIANAFNNQTGLIEIDPKQQIEVSWGVKKLV